MKHPLYYTLIHYTVMSFKYKQFPLIKIQYTLGMWNSYIINI